MQWALFDSFLQLWWRDILTPTCGVLLSGYSLKRSDEWPEIFIIPFS
jgi:hypothetical protein